MVYYGGYIDAHKCAYVLPMCYIRQFYLRTCLRTRFKNYNNKKMFLNFSNIFYFVQDSEERRNCKEAKSTLIYADGADQDEEGDDGDEDIGGQ